MGRTIPYMTWKMKNVWNHQPVMLFYDFWWIIWCIAGSLRIAFYISFHIFTFPRVEFREPWFLEENKWWKPPWSGISVENYLGVKTHQRTRFKPWWFHEGLPSYMCQWWYQWYLKWFLEIHGPLASPWHADDSFALDGTSLVSRPSLLQKLLFPCNLSKKSL